MAIAFLFYVIMALLIAISVIAFVSNYKIKKDGIKEEVTKVAQNSGADEIVKYKELLDKGIITQEEYDAKKKQLLGL